MRTPLFRVWEVVARRYTKSHVIDGDGRVYIRAVKDCPYNTSVSDDSVVVERFTGQHDKTGKPIYEGDLLRGPISTGWSHKVRRKDWVSQVKWCDWNAGWVMKGVVRGDYRFFPTWKQCEVIGNVHETPHLIDAEKVADLTEDPA